MPRKNEINYFVSCVFSLRAHELDENARAALLFNDPQPAGAYPELERGDERAAQKRENAGNEIIYFVLS